MPLLFYIEFVNIFLPPSLQQTVSGILYHGWLLMFTSKPTSCSHWASHYVKTYWCTRKNSRTPCYSNIFWLMQKLALLRMGVVLG